MGLGRLATMGMKNQSARANVVLAASVAGAAGGAYGTSYYTSKKLLTA